MLEGELGDLQEEVTSAVEAATEDASKEGGATAVVSPIAEGGNVSAGSANTDKSTVDGEAVKKTEAKKETPEWGPVIVGEGSGQKEALLMGIVMESGQEYAYVRDLRSKEVERVPVAELNFEGADSADLTSLYDSVQVEEPKTGPAKLITKQGIEDVVIISTGIKAGERRRTAILQGNREVFVDELIFEDEAKPLKEAHPDDFTNDSIEQDSNDTKVSAEAEPVATVHELGQPAEEPTEEAA